MVYPEECRKTVTFTKGNTKPKLDISSYNSTTAIFTAIDADNNLSKNRVVYRWCIKGNNNNRFNSRENNKLWAYRQCNTHIKILLQMQKNATAEKV